jgi:hypothetical protein
LFAERRDASRKKKNATVESSNAHGDKSKRARSDPLLDFQLLHYLAAALSSADRAPSRGAGQQMTAVFPHFDHRVDLNN